jgi:hypothetical protein
VGQVELDVQAEDVLAEDVLADARTPVLQMLECDALIEEVATAFRAGLLGWRVVAPVPGCRCADAGLQRRWPVVTRQWCNTPVVAKQAASGAGETTRQQCDSPAVVE